MILLDGVDSYQSAIHCDTVYLSAICGDGVPCGAITTNTITRHHEQGQKAGKDKLLHN